MASAPENIHVEIAALVDQLDAEWRDVDLNGLSTVRGTALNCIAWTGLVTLRIPVWAWVDDAAVECECTVSGQWQEVLPDRIRDCLPAWSEKRVAVQMGDTAEIRLTSQGEEARAKLLTDDVMVRELAFLTATTNLQPATIQVRVTNTNADVPGRPAESTLPGWMDGLDEEQPPPPARRTGKRGRPRVNDTPEEERIYGLWMSERDSNPTLTFAEFAEKFALEAARVEAIVQRVRRRRARRKRD